MCGRAMAELRACAGYGDSLRSLAQPNLLEDTVLSEDSSQKCTHETHHMAVWAALCALALLAAGGRPNLLCGGESLSGTLGNGINFIQPKHRATSLTPRKN